MKNAALHTLIVTILLGTLAGGSLAGDYKSTLEEHWLRILSPEENLDFGHMHPTLDAAGAVDGKRHENWAFYTEKRGRESWWEVDLAKDVNVGRIDIYNARNGESRAHILQILFSSDHDNWETVYDNKGKVKFRGGREGQKPLSVRFDGEKTRWVRIRIPRYDYMHLSEVEVYAKGDDKKNIALGQYATQSSTSGRSTLSYKGPLVNGARPMPPLPPDCKSLRNDPKLKYSKYVTAEVISDMLVLADKTIAYVAPSVKVDTQKSKLDAIKKRWSAKSVSPDKYAEFYVALRHLRRDVILRHPDLKIEKLLINRVPPPAYSHNGDQHLGRHARLGPGLTILENWKTDIKARPMLAPGKLPKGSVRNPDLHYDAEKVVFAFCDHTRQGHKRFFIYEAALDGSTVRQITGTPRDPLKTSGDRATVLIEDNDPCYLPDGDIMFTSTRCQSYGRCHGGRYNPAWTLYRMKSDGSGIRQISFNNENEYEPAVLNDGRIVFTRWEYTFRHEMFFHMLWWCRPDGTEVSNFYGADTLHPMMVVEATPIPGTNKIVATAQGHHSYNTGTSIVINPKLGENGEEPVTRITTETPYSESPGSGWPKPHWSHPHPVNEELFFVSRANHRVYKQGMLPPKNNRAIYLVDSLGGREFIYEDPSVASFSPIPIRKRKRPPVLPSRLVPGQEYGTLFVQNVYLTRNDPDGVIKPGMIKAIRLNALGVQGRAMRSGLSPTNYSVLPKKVLGTIPVGPDGSAFFKAPANTALQLQILDKNGMAILTEKSFFYLQPGENRSCVGCHEPAGTAPIAGAVAKMARSQPRDVIPPAGPNYPGGNSFHRSVQPVLDRYCIKCHGLEKKEKDINFINDGPVEPKGLPRWYRSHQRAVHTEGIIAIAKRGKHLVGYKPFMAGRDADKRDRNVSVPRRYFAYTNIIAQMLAGNEELAGKKYFAAHKNLKVDRESYMQFIEWLDLNCQACGDLFPNKVEERAFDAAEMLAVKAYAKELFGARFAKDPDYALINPAQPDQSRILLAPLPLAKGGWGQLSGYASKDGAKFKKMVSLVDAAIVRLPNENTRGWNPSLDMGAADTWVLEDRKLFYKSLGRKFEDETKKEK